MHDAYIGAFPAEGQLCCEPEASAVVSLHTYAFKKEHSWTLEGDDQHE